MDANWLAFQQRWHGDGDFVCFSYWWRLACVSLIYLFTLLVSITPALTPSPKNFIEKLIKIRYVKSYCVMMPKNLGTV